MLLEARGGRACGVELALSWGVYRGSFHFVGPAATSRASWGLATNLLKVVAASGDAKIIEVLRS